jgi:hypothetical protein
MGAACPILRPSYNQKLMFGEMGKHGLRRPYDFDLILRALHSLDPLNIITKL